VKQVFIDPDDLIDIFIFIEEIYNEWIYTDNNDTKKKSLIWPPVWVAHI